MAFSAGGFMGTDKFVIKQAMFHQRMLKYALIPRFIYDVDQTVGIREKILDHRMSGLEAKFTELIDRGIISASVRGIFREKAEENTREDIEEYLPILYNQALVMMCTTFDVFLIDSVEVITRKQPTILHSLTDPKDISITEVINATDYEILLDTIRKRALKRFDYGGIEDKVRILNKKVDLDTDGVFKFKFQVDAIRNKFPKSYESLVSAYNNRHGIVHRDEQPIKTPDDLSTVADLFSNLIMNFGWEMSERFDIQTDFVPESIKGMLEQSTPKT
jgi:hypothetical protein